MFVQFPGRRLSLPLLFLSAGATGLVTLKARSAFVSVCTLFIFSFRSVVLQQALGYCPQGSCIYTLRNCAFISPFSFLLPSIHKTRRFRDSLVSLKLHQNIFSNVLSVHDA